jgi:uncharacterized membrane protein
MLRCKASCVRIRIMTLQPLFETHLVIGLHALAAMAALLLGISQLALRKGGLRHKTVGYAWMALMLAVAISSFFIQDIRLLGPFSPIHLLSLLVLFNVPYAVWAARTGNIVAHRKAMTSLFWTALVGAGVFTLLPGRIMNQVIFGP